MLGDFLKAEWKTLLIIAIFIGGAFAFLMTETTAVKQRTPSVEPVILPGEAWLPLRIGMSGSEVEAELGPAPERVEVAFGVVELRYPEAGWRVRLHNDRVTVIGRSPEPARDDSFPSGDTVKDWSSVRKRAGGVVFRTEVVDGRRFSRYNKGTATWEVRVAGDSDDEEERWELEELLVMP